VVRFLGGASLDNAARLVGAFRQGLKEVGFVEGQNVAIELRSAEGHNDRLSKLVTELIRLPVAAIACNVSAASVAKEITSTLPIVFATGYDPIEEGTSLSRPGGNITGVSFLGNMLGAKQVELLRELVPKATTIAVLLDTSTSLRGSASELKDVETAGHSLGQHLNVLHAKDERDLDNASAILDRQRADALIVLGAAFFLSQRDRIIAMAER